MRTVPLEIYKINELSSFSKLKALEVVREKIMEEISYNYLFKIHKNMIL